MGSYILVSDADNPPFPAPSPTVQLGDVGDPGRTRELLDPGDKGPKAPELAQHKGEGKPCDPSCLDVLVGAKTVGSRCSSALVGQVQSSELGAEDGMFLP